MHDTHSMLRVDRSKSEYLIRNRPPHFGHRSRITVSGLPRSAALRIFRQPSGNLRGMLMCLDD
jgi:hypothetical protein